MMNRNIDEKIFKMIQELEDEEEKRNPSDKLHSDVVVPVIYNMFNLTEEEADIYYWIATTWSCAYKAGALWVPIDFEITYEDNHYTCVAWWISIELYVSLVRCLQALNRITDILIDYEPD